MKSFINFSNHPSESWSVDQITAAEQYGEIKDYPFPSVPGDADEEMIASIADIAVEKILSMDPAAVMCQGEFTLTFAVISRLIKAGIAVLAACSERQVQETEDGKKIVSFHFEGFRCYNKLM